MRNHLFRKKPVIEQVTDDLVQQQQVASAEQFRQDYVDQMTNGISKQIDEALEDLKPKGFILEDPMADTALLGSLALMGGVGLGKASGSKDEDDEMIKKAKELGLIT